MNMKVKTPDHEVPNGYTLKGSPEDVCDECGEHSRMHHFFAKNHPRKKIVHWLCYKCAKALFII